MPGLPPSRGRRILRCILSQESDARRSILNSLRIEALRYLDRGPIHLTIEPGECVTVAGPSGCGKSLMLRAIADLDPFTGGRVMLGNDASSDMEAPSWRARVGLLPAESQWWSDKVEHHFSRSLSHPPTGAEAQPSPAVWLNQLGFGSDVMSWSVSRLSTGEKQRLALVRLLCNLPQALLLDEPTASLDPGSVTRVEDLLRAYRQDHALPVLWVTHDPQQTARVADRGFRMDAGQLVEQIYP